MRLDSQDIMERIAQNPGSAGAVVLFFGTFVAICVNAVFLQSERHPAALFETRLQQDDRQFALQADERQVPALSVGEIPLPPKTRIVFDDKPSTTPVTLPIPTAAPITETSTANDDLAQLQTMLSKLGLYGGKIDGIDGPNTQAAIADYKSAVGLSGIDLTLAELLISTRNNLIVTAAIPTQRPSGEQQAGANQAAVEPAPVAKLPVNKVQSVAYTPPKEAPATKPNDVLLVQQGLKSFGNTAIVVDGIAGSQTIAAVREFQALFKLPVDGVIDAQLVDKMRDVGLID